MKKNEYIKFYSLDFKIPHKHKFGEFTILDKKVTYQFFQPEADIKGVILLMHGYYDHTGNLANIIEILLKSNYAIAVYDMLGHGLSEGEKASIDDFGEYLESLEIFIPIIKKYFPNNRYHVIAHSTGCSVVMEYLLQKNTFFDKIILAAPLVRCKKWKFTKSLFNVCYPLYKFKLIKNFKRKFGCNSSDKEYLKFRIKDPLQHDEVSLRWYYSLLTWNNRIREYEPYKDKIYIIQGTKDATVEWKFNLKFIKKLFLNCETKIIKNANHQLFNESKEFREETFNWILDVLKNH